MLKVLILILAISFSRADDLVSIGKAKADELRSLSNKFGGNIKLNASMFQRFVVDYPRPYTLVIFFTSGSLAKFKCQTCDDASNYLNQISYSYREVNSEFPTNTPHQKSRAVFFATMEYNSESQPIYQKLKFTSVPNLIVSNPKSISDEGGKYNVNRDEVWELHKDGNVDIYKLLEFINTRSGRSVELKTPPLDAILTMGTFMLMLVTSAFVIYKLKTFLLIPYV